VVLEVKEYASIEEFIRYLDKEIESLRNNLGELLKVVEDLRAEAEKIRKLRETLSKLVEGIERMGSKEVDLKDIKLLVNPTVEDEASLMEDLVADVQERILTFQKVRKAVEPLVELGELPTKVRVVFKDGKPVKLIIKTS